MHKGLHLAYTTSPHDVRSMIKAVYRASYRLALMRQEAALHTLRWIHEHGFWDGEQHVSWRLSKGMGLDGVTGVWEQHEGCLQVLAGCTGMHVCVCVCVCVCIAPVTGQMLLIVACIIEC